MDAFAIIATVVNLIALGKKKEQGFSVARHHDRQFPSSRGKKKRRIFYLTGLNLLIGDGGMHR
jgi:hypothetical protein